jgi:hypothetical protein
VTRTILLLAALFVAACASRKPHRVTDLESGRVYYTKDMHRGLSSGKIRLIDARTGETVTVGSSKVEEVPEAEFAREVSAK